jgi:replication factor C subunit 1
MSICFKEGLKLAPNVVDALVSTTRGDIRQILNQLSMFHLKNNEMSFADAKKVSEKDVSLSIFDVASKLFLE